MAPPELIHCTPPWMSPSGRCSSPAASTWSDTKDQKVTSVTMLVILTHFESQIQYKIVGRNPQTFVHRAKISYKPRKTVSNETC